MSTAILEQTEVGTATHHHGIPLPEQFEASPENQVALDALSMRCFKQNAMVEASLDSLDNLLADAVQTKVRELDEGGAMRKRAEKLLEQRADLESSAVAIAWEKFELRPRLVPDFQLALKKATETHERVLGEQIQWLKDMGVLDAMPANDANPVAAERQLRKKAEQDENVMAALGVRNRIKTGLRVFESQLGTCPRSEDCTIAWPTFTGFAGKIAALLGIQ